eukprot:298670-Amphidinium_carterae.1
MTLKLAKFNQGNPLRRCVPEQSPAKSPKATLIFFQTMVAGDSWGHCTISIINKHPATFLVFASALISVQLGQP